MRNALASRWPLLAVRGAFAVLFGVLAILWPGATILTLVLLFGVYALADGLFSGGLAMAKQPPQPRWLLGIEAALGLVVAFLAFTRPGVTAVTMLMVAGLWALVLGGLRIAQAIALRKQLENEWSLVVSGALSIVVGLLVVTQPAAAALAFAWVIGILAIALGTAEISLATRLRNLPEGRQPRLWAMRVEETPEAARRDKIER